MIPVKSPFLQLSLTVITFMLILGALSMIWPAILTVLLGVLLLLQSFSADPEITELSRAEVGNVPIIFALLRRVRLPARLSYRVRVTDHRLLRVPGRACTPIPRRDSHEP
jgi:hypothetical protein